MPVPDSAAHLHEPAPSGGQWQIQDETLESVSGAGVFPATPNDKFFLVHYPDNWEVASEGLPGPTWLPQLQRDWLTPGVNAKRTITRGEKPEAAYDQSHLIMSRQGFTVLPFNIQCGGRTGYVRSVACRDPRTGREGRFYFEWAEKPRTPRQGQRPKFDLDRAAYNRWRLALVLEGHITPPDPDVLRDAVGRAEGHVGRQATKTELSEERREALTETAKAKFDTLRGARIPGRFRAPARAAKETSTVDGYELADETEPVE